MEIDATNSNAPDNIISYTTFNGDPSPPFIIIDGGTISYNDWTGTSQFSGDYMIRKVGVKSLTITRNTFDFGKEGIDITGGNNATIISYNDMASRATSIRQNGGSGTVATYNTILARGRSTSDSGVAFHLGTGFMSMTYNNITIEGVSGMSQYGVNHLSGEGTSTFSFNNIEVDDSQGAHLNDGVSGGVTTVDNNYFTGCAGSCSGSSSANPTVTGSSSAEFTVTNTQGSPWPTSGAGCVGHTCP